MSDDEVAAMRTEVNILLHRMQAHTKSRASTYRVPMVDCCPRCRLTPLKFVFVVPWPWLWLTGHRMRIEGRCNLCRATTIMFEQK